MTLNLISLFCSMRWEYFPQIILWKSITASQGEKHFRMKKNSDLFLLEDYEVVTENSRLDLK